MSWSFSLFPQIGPACGFSVDNVENPGHSLAVLLISCEQTVT
jgi:hypothetical protein